MLDPDMHVLVGKYRWSTYWVSEAERHLVVTSILNNGYISGAEILLAAEKEENVKKSYVSF